MVSSIWTLFMKDDEKQASICKLCSASFAFRRNNKGKIGGTSNLWRHAKGRHPEMVVKLENSGGMDVHIPHIYTDDQLISNLPADDNLSSLLPKSFNLLALLSTQSTKFIDLDLAIQDFERMLTDSKVWDNRTENLRQIIYGIMERINTAAKNVREHYFEAFSEGQDQMDRSVFDDAAGSVVFMKEELDMNSMGRMESTSNVADWEKRDEDLISIVKEEEVDSYEDPLMNRQQIRDRSIRLERSREASIRSTSRVRSRSPMLKGRDELGKENANKSSSGSSDASVEAVVHQYGNDGTMVQDGGMNPDNPSLVEHGNNPNHASKSSQLTYDLLLQLRPIIERSLAISFPGDERAMEFTQNLLTHFQPVINSAFLSAIA